MIGYCVDLKLLPHDAIVRQREPALWASVRTEGVLINLTRKSISID
jgi:hypothetical protein